ncbi:uncharacterized protein LOC116025486 [Ipomoea triloba]|uniref:uncharacterized protein LOC116025486 n=1 Tax=Ipomoea triloba TaxID=35885 RepID=UPI00125E9984|nr:uncharacterized protein LOC116025486 [Ipomoea triloba]
MNFLMMRSNQTAAPEPPPAQEIQAENNNVPKLSTSLDALIAEDPFQHPTSSENCSVEGYNHGNENGGAAGVNVKCNHVEVTEDEGWIVIPKKELPDNWSEAPDISSLRSMDRFFVFPGEQVKILACLSAYREDIEIITPFKVAALMNKNGVDQNSKSQNGSTVNATNPVSDGAKLNDGEYMNQNGTVKQGKYDLKKEASAGESLLRREDHRRQTESLLLRMKTSHFFARIAEPDEVLWTRRKATEDSSKMIGENVAADDLETQKTTKKKLSLSAAIDRGNFDAITSGGVARNAMKSCALPNGDIVVLLQVNVGVEFFRDPVLEILQFEKTQVRSLSGGQDSTYIDQDPCGELLKWVLPLDNSIPPAQPPSPQLNSSPTIRTTTTRSTSSPATGSQLFSFGNFRSYSMSSVPSNTIPPPSASTPNSKPNFDPEDWEQFSFQKAIKSEHNGTEGLLSFRGVSLEPERFSVHCGLEGIFMPGRRWRRKIEIIQPLEIKSFSANCNTDDLLCVQIKNVAPEHTPDVVLYLDAITIVYEEASQCGPPLSLPIACIEAGDDHCLPNLTLRRGEEHSFILKPAACSWKNSKGHSEKSSQLSHIKGGNIASASHQSSNIEGRNTASTADKYAILVSCGCNYTESKLFFKHPTSWRPRISRDLMISVASEMSKQTLVSDESGAQLPVQVLTLQASNLTSEDLTMTVRAPGSFTSPPSVLSLSSSPTSPLSPFLGSSEFTERLNNDKQAAAVQRLSSTSESKVHELKGHSRAVSFNEKAISLPNVLPTNDLGCTHLWLQSKVPLGCIPSQSTATIKLEVLPLTDGIITLNSLQIDVKEKGLTYIPEESLKIYATSSISTAMR